MSTERQKKPLSKPIHKEERNSAHKDNTIHLTRGDTARFAIGRVVNTVTKTNYTPTTEVT